MPSAQVEITDLPRALALTGTESVPIVQNGVTVQTTTGAISGAGALNYPFLTVGSTAGLTQARYLSTGTGLSVSDGGAGNALTVNLTGAALSLDSSGTGLQVKTGPNTLTGRLFEVSAGLTIANADGVSGNPLIGLGSFLSHLISLSGTGVLAIQSGSVNKINFLGTTNQINVANSDGSGDVTLSLASNPILPGTGAVTIPSGTTGQQPSGSVGMLRYNSTTDTFDGYASGGWRQFSLSGGVTTFSAGSTGLTPNSATGGAVVLGGTLNVSSGGTGTNSLVGYVKGSGTSALTASVTIPTTDLSGTVTNAQLANSSITINGNTVSLGGSTTVTAIAPYALTIGSGLSGTSYNGSAPVTITNTAPDQIVSLTGAGTTVVTGTYPNFTITSNDQYSGTVTSVGTGTGLTGGPITTTGTISFAVAAVGTWAATPSSANLAAAMTDETGSGSLVFANSPTLSGPTIDGSNPYLQFNNGSAVALAAGKMWYDGSTGSLNFGMGGGNITQQVGEELFVYGKASNTIADSPLQIIYQTGTVGASGTITFGHTVAGITNGDLIIGVATEPIATNGFGRVTSFGVIHGITTNGTAYGETWHDGDVIWYNPVTGNPTNVKPVAPNLKVSVGIIINAGSGGSGSFQVEINHGSVLGGTDSNVQLTSVSNNDLLQYSSSNGYWQNVAPSTISIGTATNLAGGTTGAIPYQTGAGATSFLSLGTTNYVLTAGASAPQYVAQSTLSVGSATNATNTGITANSTNATNYLTFVSATTGNLPQLVNSGITCNPSTGQITGGISGGSF